MKDVVITDTFENAGLELIPSSFVVKDNHNNTLANPGDYTVSTTTTPPGFKLNFVNDVTEKHTISYKTKYDWKSRDDNAAGFQNVGKIGWKDTLLVSHTKITNVVSSSPNAQTKNNGIKKASTMRLLKKLLGK